MSGNGPAPSLRHARDRDTRRRLGGAEILTPDVEVRGPALGGEHNPKTIAWHEAWRRSPMAAHFLSTDWARLDMLALLVDRYYSVGRATDLAEIRLTEAALGGSPADRMRLRWLIDTPPAQTASSSRYSPVPSLAERRAEQKRQLDASA